MNPENEEGSLFSKFKKTPEAAVPAPVPQAAHTPGAPVVPLAPAVAGARADDGKMAALEAAVSELKEELAALKGAARQTVGAPPSAPPERPAPALAPLDDLKREMSAGAEGVKRAAGTQAQLAVRMERCENLIAELKALVSSQQAQLNKYAEAKLVAEGLSEYLRDLVARLNAKLVEAENTMHMSLSNMSARLTSSEAIYGKMFSDAEDRVKKSLGGEITAMDAQVKKLLEDVVWLSNEYKIVMTGKIHALEEKYSSVLEAIAKRIAH
ncbi:MAG: hypothetical protein COT18_03705 [Elusimicrobia bacterium CG08_land_8_20_14_0_20_59_10]|nr:MAG: hypothetical protein COT18_03705 [Elusimicrobia bacterium CG08_land_8_20_14_0_20_59_10]